MKSLPSITEETAPGPFEAFRGFGKVGGRKRWESSTSESRTLEMAWPGYCWILSKKGRRRAYEWLEKHHGADPAYVLFKSWQDQPKKAARINAAQP